MVAGNEIEKQLPRSQINRGALPGDPNPDPISDQNIPFSTAVFRPGL